MPPPASHFAATGAAQHRGDSNNARALDTGATYPGVCPSEAVGAALASPAANTAADEGLQPCEIQQPGQKTAFSEAPTSPAEGDANTTMAEAPARADTPELANCDKPMLPYPEASPGAQTNGNDADSDVDMDSNDGAHATHASPDAPLPPPARHGRKGGRNYSVDVGHHDPLDASTVEELLSACGSDRRGLYVFLRHRVGGPRGRGPPGKQARIFVRAGRLADEATRAATIAENLNKTARYTAVVDPPLLPSDGNAAGDRRQGRRGRSRGSAKGAGAGGRNFKRNKRAGGAPTPGGGGDTVRQQDEKYRIMADIHILCKDIAEKHGHGSEPHRTAEEQAANMRQHRPDLPHNDLMMMLEAVEAVLRCLVRVARPDAAHPPPSARPAGGADAQAATAGEGPSTPPRPAAQVAGGPGRPAGIPSGDMCATNNDSHHTDIHTEPRTPPPAPTSNNTVKRAHPSPAPLLLTNNTDDGGRLPNSPNPKPDPKRQKSADVGGGHSAETQRIPDPPT